MGPQVSTNLTSWEGTLNGPLKLRGLDKVPQASQLLLFPLKVAIMSWNRCKN